MARAHTTHETDCNSLARRCSGALLLLAIASLLVACGGGGSAESAAGGGGGGSTSPNTATLAWDAVTAPNLQGYRVYYRTAAGTYQPVAQGQPVGNGTTTYQLTNLSSQTTYFMVVTAYDSQGNESGYSNVVSKTIP